MHTAPTAPSRHRLLTLLVTLSVVLAGVPALAAPVAAGESAPNGSRDAAVAPVAPAATPDPNEPNDDPADATRLDPGERVRGYGTFGDVDLFAVNASPGGVVAASLEPVDQGGGYWVVLAVTDDYATPYPGGLADDVARDSATPAFAAAAAPPDGEALVAVEVTDGGGVNYTLTVDVVTRAATDAATRLLPSPRSDTVRADGADGADERVDYYALEGTAGGELSVVVESPPGAGGATDYASTLYRAVGATGLEPVERFDAAPDSVVLPADGTYYLEVRSGEPGGPDGPYDLAVALDGEPLGLGNDAFEPNDDLANATRLEPGAVVDGASVPGDRDLFRVNATAGEFLSANLFVTDADGTSGELLFGIDPPDAASFDGGWVVPPGGWAGFNSGRTAPGREWVLVVGHSSGTGDDLVADYTLVVDAVTLPATDAVTRLSRTTLSETVASEGTAGVDYYAVEATRGQELSIRLERTTGGEGLLAPTLYQRWDGGFQRPIGVTVDPDVPGRYTAGVDRNATYLVGVRTLGDPDAGVPYRLTVALDGVPLGLPNDRFEPNDAPGEATPLTLGEREDGLYVVDGDVDRFTVALSAGDSFRATVDYDVAAGEALTLALVDPTGQTLTGSATPDGRRLVAVAPVDGTYRLRVSGDGDGTTGYSLLARVATPATLAFASGTGTLVLPPGEETTVDVVLSGAAAGLDAYAFAVRSPDPANAGVVAVAPAGRPGSASATVAPDGSEARLVVAGADVATAGGTGEGTVVARVTLAAPANATADARVAVTLREATATDADGFDYAVTATGVDVRVASSGPTPNPDGPGDVTGRGDARDADGDGLYEDVDGDGVATLEDVFALAFDVLPRVAADPSLVPFFDFDGDGDVDLDDVFALAFG